MTVQSILVVVGLIVLFTLAIWFIARQGGWQGGCSGNCSECGSKCSTPGKTQPGSNKKD